MLGIIGVIAQIFLPETLHEKLPETLHEAKTFGKYQDYWSFPRREKDNIYMMAHLRRLKLETIDESDAEN